MIFLRLFLSFFVIGAISFGGGYGMISLVRETVLSEGWMSESEFLDLIAVSESTPGPFAVNMATYVGARQAGIPGALSATLGVILPSFLVILLICVVLRSFLRYRGVNAFLDGVRPCVVGLILSTAVIMGMSTLFGFSSVGDGVSADGKGIFLLALLTAVGLLYRKLRKKQISPLLMIALSAVLGVVLYGLLP